MNAYRHLLCSVLLASPLFSSFATAAEPGCKYVEVARLPLRYAGIGLDITTEGSINGTAATMIVDTGSFQTLLTRTATERRKLALRNTGESAYGIGGNAWIYQTRVDEFSIGPAKSGRTWLRVLTEFGIRPHYEALVGAPFLLQSDLEISLATKELKFFRPKDCGDHFLGYWDQNAVVLPFDKHMHAAANPHFTVVVNGVKLDAIIDSGASTSFVTLNAARRAGLALDAPELVRAGEATGVGTRKVARWRTTFKRFEIGDEVVHNAEVGVLDYEGTAEVLLGADFLRAHRVLFAMSQEKIYLSYIGGEPFGQRHTLEPWIQAEAEAGNADAQMALATYYMAGKLVPRDPALAAQWAEKAARAGNAEANILTGHKLLLESKYGEAVTRLRAGLDKLPTHHAAALDLYLARVRSGQAELARTELADARLANRDNEWPAPITDFYLGKLNAAQVLAAAAKDAKLSRERSCQTVQAMGQWHSAHGDQAALPALAEQRTSLGCPNAAAALLRPQSPQPPPQGRVSAGAGGALQ
jgi:clan AA aspartic protease (TIGR02281 family)